MLTSPRVSIIVLNWNGVRDTIECLESLQRITYPDYEVIVVDNGSDGDDAEVLEERFGDYIHLIRNDRNLGFAGGNNVGMRYAMKSGAQYVLLLNNDTVVDADFLTHLVEQSELDDRIGIVGPKIYYHDFKGRSDIIWSAGGRIQWWRLQIYRHIGLNDEDLPRYRNTVSVDWVTGAALMIKRCVIERLSFLNPRYFFRMEDVEYCIRARKEDYRVVYVPAAMVWHKVGASTRRVNPGLADPTPYYALVRDNFSRPVYVYQLLLLPVRLFRWAVIYLIRYRDRRSLHAFMSDFKRFVMRGRGSGVRG